MKSFNRSRSVKGERRRAAPRAAHSARAPAVQQELLSPAPAPSGPGVHLPEKAWAALVRALDLAEAFWQPSTGQPLKAVLVRTQEIIELQDALRLAFSIADRGPDVSSPAGQEEGEVECDGCAGGFADAELEPVGEGDARRWYCAGCKPQAVALETGPAGAREDGAKKNRRKKKEGPGASAEPGGTCTCCNGTGEAKDASGQGGFCTCETGRALQAEATEHEESLSESLCRHLARAGFTFEERTLDAPRGVWSRGKERVIPGDGTGHVLWGQGEKKMELMRLAAAAARAEALPDEMAAAQEGRRHTFNKEPNTGLPGLCEDCGKGPDDELHVQPRGGRNLQEANPEASAPKPEGAAQLQKQLGAALRARGWVQKRKRAPATWVRAAGEEVSIAKGGQYVTWKPSARGEAYDDLKLEEACERAVKEAEEQSAIPSEQCQAACPLDTSLLCEEMPGHPDWHRAHHPDGGEPYRWPRATERNLVEPLAVRGDGALVTCGIPYVGEGPTDRACDLEAGHPGAHEAAIDGEPALVWSDAAATTCTTEPSPVRGATRLDVLLDFWEEVAPYTAHANTPKVLVDRDGNGVRWTNPTILAAVNAMPRALVLLERCEEVLKDLADQIPERGAGLIEEIGTLLETIRSADTQNGGGADDE